MGKIFFSFLFHVGIWFVKKNFHFYRSCCILLYVTVVSSGSETGGRIESRSRIYQCYEFTRTP